MIALLVGALALVGAARVIKLAIAWARERIARVRDALRRLARRRKSKRAPKVDTATAILALAASIAAIAQVAAASQAHAQGKRIP